ncbi:MAG: transposase [Dehalococcoidia bacterium]
MGFADECWWSRLAQPALHTWTEGAPLRLVEQSVGQDDPDPTALACYGLLVRQDAAKDPAGDELWLRFVDGRPVSAITTQFLAWCCDRLAARGKTTLLLVWDNASWHGSGAVRQWLRAHNQRVQREGGVRIIPCFLPSKSPWLNPIEPKWVHGKRRIVEPARLLSARDLEQRVCAALGCPLTDHLAIPQEVV